MHVQTFKWVRGGFHFMDRLIRCKLQIDANASSVKDVFHLTIHTAAELSQETVKKSPCFHLYLW